MNVTSKNTLTVEQTVDIPANHRLFIDVSPEVPAGRTILTFTPAAAVTERAETGPFKSAEEAFERFRGISKKYGSKLTSGMALAWRQEDREQEEAEYRRRQLKKEAAH
jgi:hypothetical protein